MWAAIKFGVWWLLRATPRMKLAIMMALHTAFQEFVLALMDERLINVKSRTFRWIQRVEAWGRDKVMKRYQQVIGTSPPSAAG